MGIHRALERLKKTHITIVLKCFWTMIYHFRVNSMAINIYYTYMLYCIVRRLDTNLMAQWQDFAAATKSIIKQLAVDLERIHGLGVRKIAVTAIGPLGCLPRMTSFLSYQNCSEVANLVSIFHNQILRQKVEELNKETKKSSFVILDLYNASLSAIMLPKHSQGN